MAHLTQNDPPRLPDLLHQRVISPSGHGSLNMSRSLGDPKYKEPLRLVSSEPSIKRILLECVR